ncbi:indolepyruvate oxidoreductase subunit beta [Ruminococcus sp.]|uniref:indolepyruvate oxidoreductase subunit beta n=1 Tax=Ruminococcus sp. TaxID=41978 RepID=UPI001B0AFC88|nr:indolepyruvate oxidoreductase subunit beta [Ruminococcus sp.]MBO5558323.1 indolepyruvate oxidoreductase subunit beta [Ruminococcus sp.]MBQ9543135.1 indolepyruvate oxidoreductase subunit beta [Ruminococcus sp.]MBR0530320.1 indolepyruvate oxidoreductase subunit beta [Ruminococcus sp.]
MQNNILICGVGGQGIVLTSKLIAASAMAQDIPVMSAETIGMAQKGGSVFSFLRLGDGLYCPMFPEKTADLLIAFEPAEAVRMLPYLKEGGKVIVNTHPIMPVTAALKGSSYNGSEMLEYLAKKVDDLKTIDGEAACKEVGSPRALNMVMLGQAVKTGVLPFGIDAVEEVMKKTVKPQFVEMNVKALRLEI